MNWRDLLQKKEEAAPVAEPVTIDGINLREVGNTIRLAGVVYVDAEQTYICLLPGEEQQLAQAGGRPLRQIS